MSDSLSNFFSHIKNAQKSRILIIEHAQSKIILSILDTLQECGYIRGYRYKKENNYLSDKSQNIKYFNKIDILLKYKNQKPAINQIFRISKPSKRIYLPAKNLTNISRKKKGWHTQTQNVSETSINLSPLIFMKGIFILSTSKGIMSHLTAFRLNLGGEVLCHVY